MNKIIAFLVGLSFFQLQSQNCPSIEAIMVDACGTEHLNEFVIISSGDNGFAVNDLQFGFNPTNTTGAGNSNINDSFTSCGLTNGDLNGFEGCSNLISIGPGENVPANSYIILQTSSDPDVIYDLSELCGNDACVYVVSNACTRSIGAFTNKSTGSPGPRSNNLAISGTTCLDNATYNTQDLSSSADGNYFIPPNTYGVASPDECVSPPIPPAQGVVPVFDDFDAVCEGDDSPLPTTSNNGINGTWQPAFNNQETTTYTFIPSTNVCGANIQATIEILPSEEPEFNFSTTVCASDTNFPDLPLVSENGIAGTWSPENISTSETEYLFTPNVLSCTTSILIDITFEEVIEPEFNLPIEVCEGENIVLPSTSDNGIEGEWTPEFNTNETTAYTFTPNSDFCAESVQITIAITDNDLNLLSNTIPDDINISCDDSVPNAPVFDAGDFCGIASITFVESSELGECSGEELIIRSWTAFSDENVELAIFTQEINITDTSPPIFDTVLDDFTQSCTEDWPEIIEVQASDNCSSVQISTEEDIIQDPSCENNFSLIRTYTATDDCGNQTSFVQEIEIVDNSGPIFNEDLPELIEVSCGEIPNPVEPEVFDECGEVSSLRFTDEQTDDCDNGIVTLRTWTAEDQCGNTSSYVLRIIENCEPVVFEGISPNNDGINDQLGIEGIACYPDNKLEIFNRYGKKVFSTNNYEQGGNFFEGNDQNGNHLVTGTYFYVFKYRKSSSESYTDIKGYVYINRSNNF